MTSGPPAAAIGAISDTGTACPTCAAHNARSREEATNKPVCAAAAATAAPTVAIGNATCSGAPHGTARSSRCTAGTACSTGPVTCYINSPHAARAADCARAAAAAAASTIGLAVDASTSRSRY